VFNEPIDCYSLLRDGGTATYRLIVRRIRDMYNSTGRFVATIRERLPHNSAYLNPQDLMALQCKEGDRIEITSDHGSIVAIAAEDAALRSGSISISHGFGGLPNNDDPSNGVSTNLLTSTDIDLQTINAMPRMSALPVVVRALR